MSLYWIFFWTYCAGAAYSAWELMQEWPDIEDEIFKELQPLPVYEQKLLLYIAITSYVVFWLPVLIYGAIFGEEAPDDTEK